MNKKEFLTEAKRKAIIADKEKAIIESFAKTFNKIKRIDENELDMGEIGRQHRSAESGINPYQEQPELSDLGQLTPYQEEMKGYISKYVNSELELNHEMSNYINLGYQGLSDTVKQGLSNDMDYQTLVQMSHDEETFRRERGGIDENEGNLDDKGLIDNINNLDDSDIGWSKDPNKGLSIYFDWDDVDEDLLLTQILNLIKKVNPNADLGEKKQSLMGSNILANFNAKLYSASQRSFSAFRGLKDYFQDNLQIFK